MKIFNKGVLEKVCKSKKCGTELGQRAIFIII